MSMINMNCPHCTVHGRVPRTLINVRLLCKKCQEPFHLNAQGIAIAGDPPPPPGSEKSVDEDKLHDPGEIVDLWLAKIVMVMKMIGGVVIATMLGLGLMMIWSNFKPNSLVGRASEVSEAILKDDIPTFNTFAYGDTGIDLFEWYGFMRPKLDAVRKRVPAANMGYVPRSKKESTEAGTAEMILRFGDKNEIARREITSDEELTGQSTPYVDVRTFWRVDNFGRWWIDGTQTLRGPTEEPKPEAPSPGESESKVPAPTPKA